MLISLVRFSLQEADRTAENRTMRYNQKRDVCFGFIHVVRHARKCWLIRYLVAAFLQHTQAPA